MIEIKNKIGNITKVYASIFEDEAYSQIEKLCNYSPYLDSKIRIMPDAHAGKGCTIGTTMTITDKITPNLVGVDIGCGMFVVVLGKIDIDLPKLDEVINRYIPSGFNIHENAIEEFPYLENMRCKNVLDEDIVNRSIGSLGGGNHFIEIDVSDNGCKYLIIHSGSRNLGVRVCNYYQDIAVSNLSNNSKFIKELIDKLKSEGREKDIQSELKKLPQLDVNKELAYLEGDNFVDYIHDMSISQLYAGLNRNCIAKVICEKMGWNPLCSFTTMHNYIEINKMILRKGAVKADEGEILIIPMNMRDGALICKGKGNPDWNYSAPHGAGRLMSRAKAKTEIKMEEFSSSMNGIYTTSICESTLDEAPQAYKPMESIISQIQDTVDVIEVVKPIYNFKDKQ